MRSTSSLSLYFDFIPISAFNLESISFLSMIDQARRNNRFITLQKNINEKNIKQISYLLINLIPLFYFLVVYPGFLCCAMQKNESYTMFSRPRAASGVAGAQRRPTWFSSSFLIISRCEGKRPPRFVLVKRPYSYPGGKINFVLFDFSWSRTRISRVFPTRL